MIFSLGIPLAIPSLPVVDIPESTSASQQQELQDEKHKEEEWTETTDLASGNICYNNSITGETSWSKPDPRQKVDDDNLSAEEDYSVDEPTPVESEVASVGTNRDSIGIPEPTNRFPTDEGVVAVVDVPESASMSQLQELREGESVPRVFIRVIKFFFYSHLQSLTSAKQVEICKLGTFQGRLSASGPQYDSTNGCAVISPLVVEAHITTSNKEYGISDTTIDEIIDERAPPILQRVRSKLGLGQHALIIPSDVQNYLVDENILPQNKFVGVCGGDILDNRHIGNLMAMLVNGSEDGSRPRKVGAALYFLEHVISIIQIPLGNGACYYDLIDSLPSSSAVGMATRTSCKDLASLKALIRWYGISKFNESQLDFIDENE